jgi:hypothetical protein
VFAPFQPEFAHHFDHLATFLRAGKSDERSVKIANQCDPYMTVRQPAQKQGDSRCRTEDGVKYPEIAGGTYHCNTRLPRRRIIAHAIACAVQRIQAHREWDPQ